MRRRGVAVVLALAAASALATDRTPVTGRSRLSLAEVTALAEQGRIGSPGTPRRPAAPGDPYRPVVAFTTWWFSSQHAARYGGLFVDDEAQVVVVNVTGDVGDYEATIRAALGPSALVEVRHVTYSLADLERGTALLRDAADRLRTDAQAVEVYGPDVETNRVWVLLDPPGDDVQRALAAALPGRDARMLHLAQAPPWAE